jgi:hypothetical protein
MLDISFAELCIVLLVAIIFVSPKNFPSLFKSMARLYKKSKNILNRCGICNVLMLSTSVASSGIIGAMQKSSYSLVDGD